MDGCCKFRFNLIIGEYVMAAPQQQGKALVSKIQADIKQRQSDIMQMKKRVQESRAQQITKRAKPNG